MGNKHKLAECVHSVLLSKVQVPLAHSRQRYSGDYPV